MPYILPRQGEAAKELALFSPNAARQRRFRIISDATTAQGA